MFNHQVIRHLYVTTCTITFSLGLLKGRTFSIKELLVNLGYKANVHYNQRPVEEPYNQRQVQLKYDWASVPYLSGEPLCSMFIYKAHGR